MRFTVSETSGTANATASRLGLRAGSVVGEIGYDDDVDAALRTAVESVIGSELLDEDADEVLDAALLWRRDDDGDLTDALVDAITLLADDGVIWVLTPRTGRAGYVDPSDIGDAARTAGLAQTTSGPAAGDWMMTKLVRSRSSSRPRR
jgi:hypothetical protein